MPKKLLNFAAQLSLPFTPAQAEKLLAYGQCVYVKKDFLNLTSVADFDELITRHLCDGLSAGACLQARLAHPRQLADAGAGCGYIGFALAAAFPAAQVTLLESLERRCQFMNWAALQAGFTNIRIKQVRLGQTPCGPFETVTERAMGPLTQILPLCVASLQPGGLFLAYQSEVPAVEYPGTVSLEPFAYTLPGENKQRYLAVYQKNEQ